MYQAIIRPLLFLLSPEKAHHFSFNWLRRLLKIRFIRMSMRSLYRPAPGRLQRSVMGLTFSHPVGLAAGFDKDALLGEDWSELGFSFVEVGTVTPKPQPGNPQPRLFRLPADKALINRMGFNNAGVLSMKKRLKHRKGKIIIGGNIGKNKVTDNKDAVSDYLYCLKELHPHVDYFVVNVSSPNTPNLRELQDKEPLRALLQALVNENRKMQVFRPILLKIAPDLTWSQLDDICELIMEVNIEGVVATNTTISREGLRSDADEIGNGGLSGNPLHSRSCEVIKYMRENLGREKVIIGVGGVMDGRTARNLLKAGADLIQVYTGFIYKGPGMVKAIVRDLAD